MNPVRVSFAHMVPPCLLPLVAAIAVVLPFGAVGCAARAGETVVPAAPPPRTSVNVHPADRLALGIDVPGELPPGSLTPPPAVAGDVVSARPAGGPSTLPLDAALAELSGETPPPAVLPEPSPEDRDAALRLFLRGRDAAARGRRLVAITDLEQARQLDPRSLEILRILAAAYQDQGDVATALARYESLRQLDPADRGALIRLGLAAADRGDDRRAVDLLGQLVTLDDAASLDSNRAALAYYTLHGALSRLGYDQASVEAGLIVVGIDRPAVIDTPILAFASAVLQRKGEIWLSIGDARCRAGDMAGALEAYVEAAQRAVVDPVGLQARAIYVQLGLGRAGAARYQLFRAIEETGPRLGPRLLAVTAWLTAAAPDDGTLADAIARFAVEQGTSPELLVAESLARPPAEAVPLLREAVALAPRDPAIAGALFDRLLPDDPDGAMAEAARLVRTMPIDAEAYVDRLLRALPDATLPLAYAGRGDPALDELAARTCARYWQLGRAWQICMNARQRHPDDTGLRRLQLELASRLDEPYLVTEAIALQPAPPSIEDWLLQARAYRAVQRGQEAVDAAREAGSIAAADERAEALTELAFAYATLATVSRDRRAAQFAAVQHADAALSLDPTYEPAYAFLLGLHGPQSPFGNTSQYEMTIERVRRAGLDGPLQYRVRTESAARSGRPRLARDIALAWYVANPLDTEALSWLGEAWSAFAPDDHEAWLRARLDERPADPVLLDELVRILLGREAYDEADEVARAATLADDDLASARLYELIARVRGDVEREMIFGDARLQAGPPGGRRALQRASLAQRAGNEPAAIEELEWLIRNAETSEMRHLVTATGVCVQLEPGPAVDDVTARLVERIDAFHAGMPLSIYAIGLRALVQQDAMARFDSLVRRAVERQAGAGDGSMAAILEWRDLAQRLVDAGHPEGASRALRARLERTTDIEEDALALLVSMAIIADAAAGDRANATVNLLLDLDARGVMPALRLSDGAATLSAAFMDASQGYTLVGDDVGAERLLREALRLSPQYAMAMNNLAYGRIDQEREIEEATQFAEAAYRLEPNDANILDTIAWLRYKQGRVDDVGDDPGAISLLKRAVQASGDEPSPEVLDHFADALWQANREQEALAVWGQVQTILTDRAFREEAIDGMSRVQSLGWGLLVVDPGELYDRGLGSLLERVQAKLAHVERGESPPVAPQFDTDSETPPSR